MTSNQGSQRLSNEVKTFGRDHFDGVPGLLHGGGGEHDDDDEVAVAVSDFDHFVVVVVVVLQTVTVLRAALISSVKMSENERGK